MLLATRQLRHRPSLGTGQPDELQQFLHAGARGTTPLPAHAQAEGDVLAHVPVREQRVILEHQPHIALVGGNAGEVATVQLDGTTPRLLQPGDDAQQRGLATAAGAQHTQQLTGGHVKVDVAQHVRVGVGGGQALDVKHVSSLSRPSNG